MHATIYQIAEGPIREEDYIMDGDLPDWFWEKMDYADVVEEPYATERCKNTGKRPGLHFDPATRLLTVKDRTEYFREKHKTFVERAKRLADCTLDAFVEGGPRLDVYCLSSDYCDGYDLYVFTEDYVLYTFDEWVRYHGNGSVYIGAVLDYHF